MIPLHEKLFRAAEKFGQRRCVISGSGEVTFERFADRVERLAGALQSLGLKKGDRISILAHNRMDYLACHFATSMIGSILHVMNTRHVVPEWSWAMNDAETSALIVDGEHAGAIPELRKRCPSLRFVVGIGQAEGADFTTDQLVEGEKRVRNVPRALPQDPVLLIYTSGTTGRPKGCLQTQEGSSTVDDLTAEVMQVTEEDVYMAIMPYFHQAGMIRSRATMNKGGANVVPEALKIEDIAQLMAEKKVTITMLVSAQQGLVLFDKAVNQGLDFSPLRLIISGGGMGRKTMLALKVLCDTLKCDFMGIYGQTECTGPVTVVSGEVAFENPDTCGKPMRGIDLEIWDENNNPLPPGSVGEIMVRSRMTTRYWKNPEANEALYTGEWLHTGDLGKLDEEGYLYFVDRKKDLIKTGGENVYPQEVETVLNQHPRIADVAVIGLPDPQWGEAVTAAVVSADGGELSLDEVRSFCRGKIAGYKIPKRVVMVESIPRNETGKVVKRKLRELFLEKEG
ncbi:AMP-binding protein [Candidatus Solincola tengchongensis]|uniref:class I adenylate-forming enzyme family protein n=1 Tax=Candidatus Solincola tengchongensis TaxID=2900693 RepID=UPI00257A1F2C|nr:AMP-binding protein [Candidatus Solincola tengchongensis]